MAITNKKELMDALISDGVMQGFAADGTAVLYTMLEDMDRDRAKTLNNDIQDNFKNYLEEIVSRKEVEVEGQKALEVTFKFTPPSLIRALLRNIELNSDIECLHVMYEIAGWHSRMESFLHGSGGTFEF